MSITYLLWDIVAVTIWHVFAFALCCYGKYKSMISYFDASVKEEFNQQLSTCSIFKFCSGNGTYRGRLVMNCFPMTNPPSLSQLHQTLLIGGTFTTHFHTVSKASWVDQFFPSISGPLFDNTVKYLFRVDRGKKQWWIQQRFLFWDSLKRHQVTYHMEAT